VHTVDVIAVCAAAVIAVVFAAVIARQRYMLRLPGAIALAMQLPSRGTRWLYGMGRYVGGELRWYRALGVGTRPTRVVRRGAVEVVRRRSPAESERTSLPSTAVILECRSADGAFSMALSEGAYTGFVSWLESSAPMS
jgi:hypothetical protein